MFGNCEVQGPRVRQGAYKPWRHLNHSYPIWPEEMGHPLESNQVTGFSVYTVSPKNQMAVDWHCHSSNAKAGPTSITMSFYRQKMLREEESSLYPQRHSENKHSNKNKTTTHKCSSISGLQRKLRQKIPWSFKAPFSFSFTLNIKGKIWSVTFFFSLEFHQFYPPWLWPIKTSQVHKLFILFFRV